jgi:superoxide dismutase, Fe-Mn family
MNNPRRTFIGGALAAGAVGATVLRMEGQGQGGSTGSPGSPSPQVKTAPPFPLPPLPWEESALAPHISAQTVGIHYGKHHRAYVDNINRMKQGTELAEASLEAIVKATAGKPERKALFNNAAQAWNHAFYWKSLSPKGGGRPTGKLKDRIDTDFGSLEKLKEALSSAAVSQFGSGWAWLVLDGGKLKVTQTSNADNPLATGQTALLTLDVWEHAYYLDYQNKRPDYVTAVLDKLLNWEFASENLG